MISTKEKRKIVHEGSTFYWYVRSDGAGILRIHIMSEDKRINLEYPLFDSEVPVTPSYIRYLLNGCFGKKE